MSPHATFFDHEIKRKLDYLSIRWPSRGTFFYYKRRSYVHEL